MSAVAKTPGVKQVVEGAKSVAQATGRGLKAVGGAGRSVGEKAAKRVFGQSATTSGGSSSTILANKEAGDAVRDIIAAREAPALIEQNLRVTGGLRRIDVLKQGDELVAFESKVGRTSLTPRVRQELARDVKLLRSGQVNEVVWEFSRSGVTGKIGPTTPLLDKLNKFDITVRIN